jgi:DtxR family Mn-dependent transcriptional regulator
LREGQRARKHTLLGLTVPRARKAPPVSTSAVAARLGVAAPSVSAMLHRLDAAGLLAGSGSGGIVLSEHGQRHAREVVRRHRLIETFLARAAGMSWDEVH